MNGHPQPAGPPGLRTNRHGQLPAAAALTLDTPSPPSSRSTPSPGRHPAPPRRPAALELHPDIDPPSSRPPPGIQPSRLTPSWAPSSWSSSASPLPSPPLVPATSYPAPIPVAAVAGPSSPGYFHAAAGDPSPDSTPITKREHQQLAPSRRRRREIHVHALLVLKHSSRTAAWSLRA